MWRGAPPSIWNSRPTMPEAYCPSCKANAPTRWDGIARQWAFWTHGPETKRCKGSGVVAVEPRRDKKEPPCKGRKTPG